VNILRTVKRNQVREREREKYCYDPTIATSSSPGFTWRRVPAEKWRLGSSGIVEQWFAHLPISFMARRLDEPKSRITVSPVASGPETGLARCVSLFFPCFVPVQLLPQPWRRATGCRRVRERSARAISRTLSRRARRLAHEAGSTSENALSRGYPSRYRRRAFLLATRAGTRCGSLFHEAFVLWRESSSTCSRTDALRRKWKKFLWRSSRACWRCFLRATMPLVILECNSRGKDFASILISF